MQSLRPSDPQPDEKPLEVELDRPHEQAWTSQDAARRMQELVQGDASEQRFARKEAFLTGLFSALPPARVLDLGRGFEPHLRTLRALGHHELHGCDTSTVLNHHLPFDDAFFDVSLTSDVLVHIEPPDMLGMLRELWRVSTSLIIHIEQHGGHQSPGASAAPQRPRSYDLPSLYREIGPVDVLTLTDVVEDASVHLVHKLGSRFAVPPQAEERLRERLNEHLAQSRDEARGLRYRLNEALDEVKELRRGSPAPVEPLAWLERLPLMGRLASGQLLRGRQRAVQKPERLELPFGGFAARASYATPLEFAEGRPEVVLLCHPDWRGIRAATYGQGRHVLEVPGIESQEQAERLATFLEHCGTRRLVINGFPPGSGLLARTIQRRQAGTTVDLVYHGTPAQAHFREDSIIDQMLQLADDGAIRKLGFVKGGLAEYFRGLGYRAEFLMNFVRMPLRPTNIRPGPDGRLHIGVFAPNISHKNVETQILAALMIPDAVVHVCEMPPMAYLRSRNRIVVHGIRPHAEFMKLLATMHATLYVSLVECYPMTVLESLAMGVVCLTSHSSVLFDSAPELFRDLVVTDHDNPHAIARKLSSALERRAELVPRAQEHLGRLNELAERRWREFLAE